MSAEPDSGTAPLVSVVIPNWNGAELLPGCLRALDRQVAPPLEAIVVDNGSTDDSLAVVTRVAPETTILRFAENRGFAVAANTGAAHARGPYVAFLNNDAEPDPSWLAELLACLERHPAAACATPKVLRWDDEERLDGAGDCLTRSLKAYRRGAGDRDDERYASEERVFAASATAALWKRSAFERLGGFDESFFAYYEDVDLGLRAGLAGFESWYAPAAVVRHRGGATSQLAREWESFHAVRNRLSMIVRSVPSSWLLRDCHLIALGEFLSLLRSVARGDGLLHLAAYRAVVRSGSLRARRRTPTYLRSDLEALRTLVRRRFPPPASTWRRRRRRPLRRAASTSRHPWVGAPARRPEGHA